MRRLRVAPGADTQIRAILDQSRETFGEAAALRYASLIEAAAIALAENPSRSGVKKAPRGLCLFHLRHCRGGAGVLRPRHILVFRYDAAELELIRVFHDAMDLPARLSDL